MGEENDDFEDDDVEKDDIEKDDDGDDVEDENDNVGGDDEKDDNVDVAEDDVEVDNVEDDEVKGDDDDDEDEDENDDVEEEEDGDVEDDDVEDEDRSQDREPFTGNAADQGRGPHCVRACAPDWAQNADTHPLCEPALSKCTATLGNLQEKCSGPEWAPWSSTGLYTYRKNPSVWTHCLANKRNSNKLTLYPSQRLTLWWNLPNCTTLVEKPVTTEESHPRRQWYPVKFYGWT